MIKTFISFVFFLFVFTCKGQSTEEGWWHTYEGKLGGSDVQLSLYRLRDGKVKGNYCYKAHETKLQLEGTSTEQKVKLSESLNGKLTGHFTGTIDKNDNFKGTWTDGAGKKTLAVNLKNVWASASPTFEHRYQDFSETDAQVEAFMMKVKTSILNGDKQWLKENIRYPLSVYVNRKKTSIKTKEQLISNYDNIFTQSFKNKVGKGCACNLFSNVQGVMLGNGEIWIADYPAGKGKTQMYIRSINNG